eukprot:897936-Prymnesium_polylepis.1
MSMGMDSSHLRARSQGGRQGVERAHAAGGHHLDRRPRLSGAPAAAAPGGRAEGKGSALRRAAACEAARCRVLVSVRWGGRGP